MQKELHPKLDTVEVTCSSCGAKFTTESTNGEFKNVEICSNCHPFYTGKQKNISKGGRIDKFNAKMSKIQPKKEKKVKVEEEATEEN